MRFVLGSTSKHKHFALKGALTKLGIVASVEAKKARSFINEQPIGLDETYRGAYNRAKDVEENELAASELLLQYSPPSYYVGIESGIVLLEDIPVDLAVVVILCPDGNKVLSTSIGLMVPMDSYKEAFSRGFERTTVGSVLAEKRGGELTDPHSTLTKGEFSRRQLLVDAICAALVQIRNTDN